MFIMNRKMNSYSSKSPVSSPSKQNSPKDRSKRVIIQARQSMQIHKPVESFSPKCMIFCLVIRKIFKSNYLKHSKFAFYLMRSLYKESKLTSRKSNVSDYHKPAKCPQKFAVLNKIYTFVKKQQEKKVKQKFFYFCKQLPRVRMIKIKRIETIKKFLKIFTLNFSKNFQKFRKIVKFLKFSQENVSKAVTLLLKITLKKILKTIKMNKIIRKKYVILEKPKKVLPIMISKPRSTTPKPRETEKQSPVKKIINVHIVKEVKNERKNFHYRAFTYLMKLNRNYAMIRQKVFLYWEDYTRKARLLEMKRLGQSVKEFIRPLVVNRFIEIINCVKEWNNYEQSVNSLVNVLEFIYYRSSMNLKANAFVNVRRENKHAFDVKKAKFLFNIVRIFTTKIFSKYFFAYMLIKGYSDQVQRNFLTCFHRSADFYKKLSKIFNKNYHKHIPESFFHLKTYSYKKAYHTNFTSLIKILRKVFARLGFCKKFESFSIIKAYSVHKHRLCFARISKLAYLLKKLHTKLIAFGFL